jgi:L-aspartate oxidase
VAGAVPRELDTDVLVVGAGVAGLCTALRAAPRRVLVLCPVEPGAGSSSALAQGGIAAPIGVGDSVALHVGDTLAAAAYAADPQAVTRVISAAADAIAYLESSGVAFDRRGDGRSLHLEAGHRRARIVHAAGDRSGAAIVVPLWQRARSSVHIDILCGWRAVELLRSPSGEIAGVCATDGRSGRTVIRARDTVLATGGIGHLFRYTTNGASATGDGLAMAHAIGARTAALEFVQFHPTALSVATDPLPLLTEALRGAGARLVTASGRRVMAGRHALQDLAPRDVVARAVWEVALSGEQVLLDATAVFSSAAAHEFPGARETALRHGLDPAVAPLPVTAAAHYHMGGVVVDAHGRTTAPGLWACGEIAYTGLHGANRLASNSLLEAAVCGCAAGDAISRSPARRRACVAPATGSLPSDAALDLATSQLRARTWQALGPVRDGPTLHAALERSALEREALDAHDLVARYRYGLVIAMLDAALQREESRGAHWRSDFPNRNPGRDGPFAVYSRAARRDARRPDAALPSGAEG